MTIACPECHESRYYNPVTEHCMTCNAKQKEEEWQAQVERTRRIEDTLSYALTVETTNTLKWMEGFRDKINRILATDGDPRRCTFDGRQLRLRNIRDVTQPSDLWH